MGHRYRLVNIPGQLKLWRDQGLTLVHPSVLEPQPQADASAAQEYTPQEPSATSPESSGQDLSGQDLSSPGSSVLDASAAGESASGASASGKDGPDESGPDESVPDAAVPDHQPAAASQLDQGVRLEEPSAAEEASVAISPGHEAEETAQSLDIPTALVDVQQAATSSESDTVSHDGITPAPASTADDQPAAQASDASDVSVSEPAVTTESEADIAVALPAAGEGEGADISAVSGASVDDVPLGEPLSDTPAEAVPPGPEADASASPSENASAGTPIQAEEAAAAVAPDDEQWPQPWDAYRQRANPPHTIIWTYFDLATDMGETPSAARRALWGRLLGNLPRGVVGFWPMSAVVDGRNVPQPEMFWRGVKVFGASHVLCFGRRAFGELFPGRSFSHEPFESNGVTVHILHDPALLLSDQDQALSLVEGVLASLRG